MAPTPTSLRVSADAIRLTARRLEIDFEPLPHQGGPDTWEGPAASSFRRGARDAGRRAEEVSGALRRLARRLDERADDLQARIDAERRRAEEQAAEAFFRTWFGSPDHDRAGRDPGMLRVPGSPGWYPTWGWDR